MRMRSCRQWCSRCPRLCPPTFLCYGMLRNGSKLSVVLHGNSDNK